MRAVHYWGSNFMVALMTMHMIQVFLFGAYKYPREMTWLSGVFLLLMTLGLAFTGQVMRFDQDAYWGLGIGASITGRVPLIGAELVHLLLAGPIIAGETLSRFFTLHVFIIPGLIIALISVHLRLVLTKGINEYPVPGKLVHKATYDHEYEEILEKDGVPFVPFAIGKDLIFAAIVMVGILGCAAVFGPKGPGGPPNPTIIQTNPRPDFYFLSIFAALALLPDWMEVLILFVAPVLDDRIPAHSAFRFGNGREESAAQTGRRAERGVDRVSAKHSDIYGCNVAMVAEDVGMECDDGAIGIPEGPISTGDSRRASPAGQAMPQLSCIRR